jgi:hypothetical protein
MKSFFLSLSSWNRLHSNFAGLPSLSCLSPNSTFVAAIYACVDINLIAQDQFRQVLLHLQTCSGGVFTNESQLQALRFCNIVQGSIIIENMEKSFDATVFWDIETIEGKIILQTL